MENIENKKNLNELNDNIETSLKIDDVMKVKGIDRDKLIKRIRERKATLKKASKELKAHFVGIDKEIDRVCKLVETWYLLPEIMTRPVIICLFGPTGVGKTDLVRRLVKLLNFQDKYCEAELTNKAGAWNKSINSVIKQSEKIESGKPGVILLDEIQSFRTIDEQGNDILDYDMKDIWTLLSDGKLPYKAEIESLMTMLWDFKKKDLEVQYKKAKSGKGKKSSPLAKGVANKIYKELCKANLSEVQTPAEEFDNKWDYYSLSYFKNVLRLEESLEEIALWDEKKKKQVVTKKLADKSIYDEEDYTKTLIFISGNIDEAYMFVKNANEVDVDADIIHNMSKRVNILDIKEALGKRFRPEQISRMGNMHVIYPSLSRKSFENIINRKIDSIIIRVKDQTGITLNINQTIKTLIYDNGVFPTQGTRPLFSTISEILETVIPSFILTALVKDKNKINISYSDKNVIATFDKESSKVEYIGALDCLKNKHNKDLNRKAISSVHESAHAIVHALLFKMSPAQIVSTPISEDMEGFVYPQDVCHSKEMINDRICVCLAGYEAERLIFGESHQTSGSSDDIRKATESAVHMVRKYGMYNNISHIASPGSYENANNDIAQTNVAIETIVREASKRTKEIILKNKVLLLEVVENLMNCDKILPEDFQKICKKHNLEIGISKSTEDIIYSDYYEKLNLFKNKS